MRTSSGFPLGFLCQKDQHPFPTLIWIDTPLWRRLIYSPESFLQISHSKYDEWREAEFPRINFATLIIDGSAVFNLQNRRVFILNDYIYMSVFRTWYLRTFIYYGNDVVYIYFAIYSGYKRDAAHYCRSPDRYGKVSSLHLAIINRLCVHNRLIHVAPAMFLVLLFAPLGTFLI